MEPATLDLTLIGGPTVLIEVAGARLVTDPTFDDPGSYALGRVELLKTTGPALSSLAVGEPDAVLLSHDQHADNFDSSGRKFAAAAKLVLTTRAANRRLGGTTVGMTPWDRRTIEIPIGPPLMVTAVPARHGPPGAEEKLGSVIGFVLSGPDGSDLAYVTGDTVFYEGVEEVSRHHQPAAVIAFAGAARTRGPFNLTMGNNDVLELARVFPRARIMVAHNTGWAHFTEGQRSWRPQRERSDLAIA